MNKINGECYNDFIFNAALKKIDKVIKLAGQYEGRCYGPYVRDVLIPRLNNPIGSHEYSKVHLEFPTNEQKELFLSQMIIKYGDRISNNLYSLNIQDMFIADFKVNVFEPKACDINRLYYLYKNDCYIFYDENTLTYYDAWDVLESPLAKNILDGQIILNATVIYKNGSPFFVDRLNHLIEKGWSIQLGYTIQTTPFEFEQFQKDLEKLNSSTMDEFKKAYREACEANKKRDRLFNQCITEYNLLETTDTALKELMMKALCK